MNSKITVAGIARTPLFSISQLPLTKWQLSLASYFEFYNHSRRHRRLGRQTPWSVYALGMQEGIDGATVWGSAPLGSLRSLHSATPKTRTPESTLNNPSQRLDNPDHFKFATRTRRLAFILAGLLTLLALWMAAGQAVLCFYGWKGCCRNRSALRV